MLRCGQFQTCLDALLRVEGRAEGRAEVDREEGGR